MSNTADVITDEQPGDPPRHIAIIMDGNGRWAQRRSLPRSAGHRRGVDTVRTVVRAAGELDIAYLTLFSFSSENWNRPKNEINTLMALLKRFIHQDLSELHNANVKVRVIGARDDLDSEIVALIEHAETLTALNSGLNLTVAFNYGGQDEIVRAARTLAQKVHNGEMSPDQVTPDSLSAHLDTAEIPDPDLVIRTSGEQRLSNFLLWQCAYAEFVFTQELWPDFTGDTLKAAVMEYCQRERRFGGLQARVTG